MARYMVTVRVSGTEYYMVEADSPVEAEENWYEGEQVNGFDSDSYDVADVEKVE